MIFFLFPFLLNLLQQILLVFIYLLLGYRLRVITTKAVVKLFALLWLKRRDVKHHAIFTAKTWAHISWIPNVIGCLAIVFSGRIRSFMSFMSSIFFNLLLDLIFPLFLPFLSSDFDIITLLSYLISKKVLGGWFPVFLFLHLLECLFLLNLVLEYSCIFVFDLSILDTSWSFFPVFWLTPGLKDIWVDMKPVILVDCIGIGLNHGLRLILGLGLVLRLILELWLLIVLRLCLKLWLRLVV